jgi:hypothetical protein
MTRRLRINGSAKRLPVLAAVSMGLAGFCLLSGCHRNGGPSHGPVPLTAKADKPADLARSFDTNGWSQYPDKEPLTLARFIARSAGGSWIALTQKPLEEVKWKQVYGAPAGTVANFIATVQQAGTPVAMAAEKDYTLLCIGTPEELAQLRAKPPQETVGLFMAGETAGSMLRAAGSFWKVRIEADPELLKLRDTLLQSRRRSREQDQEAGVASADTSDPWAAGQGASPQVEFKVADRIGRAELVQRLGKFLGGEGTEAGGKWRFVRLTNPTKIAEEVKRLRQVIEERATDSGAAFTSFASRNGGAQQTEEEAAPVEIPDLGDEAQQAVEGLAVLGKPGMDALVDLLNPEKPSRVKATIQVLGALDTPECRKALVTFARDLPARSNDKVRPYRPALETQIVRALGRKPSGDSVAVLGDIARNESSSSEARLQARLALVSAGELKPLLMSVGKEYDPRVAERKFNLEWPLDPKPPGAAAPAPAAAAPGVIKPMATFTAPGGETWAVFLSMRYGGVDDIWLARGAAGAWQDFLFTGRQFKRSNSYGYQSGGTSMKGACVLKVDGDRIEINPPNPQAAAEEKKLRKMMEDPKLKPQDRSKLYQKYAEISTKVQAMLKSPIILSLDVLRKDTDGDGLPDLVEQRLMLDSTKADTNGDKIPDGRDMNPLTAKAKQQTHKAALIGILFTAMFGGDPSPEPILVVLDRKDWQAFPATGARVICITPQDYMQRGRQLIGLRSLQFGGPKDANSTILQKDGPCLFNDSKTKAEIHFWQWHIPPGPNGMAYLMGGRGGSGNIVDYVAHFEQSGGWKLTSVKPWKYDTASQATSEISRRAMTDNQDQ